MENVKPAKLSPGDTVGIVSPASRWTAFCPRRLQRGIACLEDMGFQVMQGDHTSARTGHTAGTIEDRVSDLHALYRHPDVRAIIPTIGGYNSNQLLNEQDFDLVAQNPKIVLGYSDVTALQLGIVSRTALVTYLGPALVPQFGECGGLLAYARESFTNVLMDPTPDGHTMQPSETRTDEILQWDLEDSRAGPASIYGLEGPQARPGIRSNYRGEHEHPDAVGQHPIVAGYNRGRWSDI